MPLLIEGDFADTVREALHHEWTVVDDGQQKRRDPHVMAHQVALGETRGRPEHFVQIRHVQCLPARQLQVAVLARLLDFGEAGEEGVVR